MAMYYRRAKAGQGFGTDSATLTTAQSTYWGRASVRRSAGYIPLRGS